MSVLIKDMKMPSSCNVCPMLGMPEVRCLYTCRMLDRDDFYKARGDNCPLIEIPPHGRLIDADELIGVCEAWRHEAQKRYAFINLRFANAVIAQVKLQPTVIEAEEETK